MLHAFEKFFATWATAKNAAGTGRSRHDYDCPEHLIAEMLNDAYFRTVMHLIEAGDLIWITDGASEQAVIRVNHVDRQLQRVAVSLVERIIEVPVTATVEQVGGNMAIVDHGLTLRNRGPRGGLWCIVDKDNNVIERDMRTKAEAERRLMAMTSQAAAA